MGAWCIAPQNNGKQGHQFRHTITEANIAHTLERTPCQPEQTEAENNQRQLLQAITPHVLVVDRNQSPNTDRHDWKLK